MNTAKKETSTKYGMGGKKRAKRICFDWVFLELVNIVHWNIESNFLYTFHQKTLSCIIYLRVVKRKIGAGILNSIKSKRVFVCVRCLLWKNIFRFSYNFSIVWIRFVSFRLGALFWSTLRFRQSVFVYLLSISSWRSAICLASVWVLSFDPSANRFNFCHCNFPLYKLSADSTFLIYIFIQ